MRTLLKPSIRKQAIGSGVGFRPSLELDFLNQVYRQVENKVSVTKTLSDLVRIARVGAGTYINQFGVQVSSPANTLRFGFDGGTKSLSVINHVLSLGIKRFPVTVQYQVGDCIWASIDANRYMSGVVLRATATQVTVKIIAVTGSGSGTSWTVIKALGIMVEESRTNDCLNSQAANTLTPTRATYTDGGVLLPDGITPLRFLQEDTSASAHFGLPATTVFAAGKVYTGSWFVKAGGRSRIQLQVQNTGAFVAPAPNSIFDLNTGTVTDVGSGVGAMFYVGDGIWRISMSVTVLTANVSSDVYPVLMPNTGMSNSYTGDGVSGLYVGGYQIEQGSLSSYIPTTGAAATRGGDTVTAASVDPWCNQSEGTLICKFMQETASASSAGITRRAASLAGTAADYIEINRNQAGSVGGGIVTGGVGQTAFNAFSVPNKQATRVALTYKTNDSAISVDKSAPITDTSVNLFTITQLGIGQRGFASSYVHGYVQNVSYIPVRVPDAYLPNV